MGQDEGWRDARVRHAEESLRAAVEKADQIVEAAKREAELAEAEPQPEPEKPPRDDDGEEPSYLRDAW